MRLRGPVLTALLLVSCNSILGNDTYHFTAPAGSAGADAGAQGGQCLLNSDCQTGYVCIFRVCGPQCAGDIDCDPGYRCLMTGVGVACVSSSAATCSADSDCPSGATCSTSDGVCRNSCGTTGCLNGQTCSAGFCVGDETHEIGTVGTGGTAGVAGMDAGGGDAGGTAGTSSGGAGASGSTSAGTGAVPGTSGAGGSGGGATPPKQNGDTCTTKTECGSGICKDGYCCDTSCTGTCQSCAVTGSEGTCSNVRGAVDADTCSGTQACSSNGECKFIDGQNCGLAGDCVNNNCTSFYPDTDGDGFGSSTSSIRICSSTTPTGYVLTNTDCCDTDKLAFPGEAINYTTADKCGSFDYNCDSIVEQTVTPNTLQACNAICSKCKR